MAVRRGLSLLREVESFSPHKSFSEWGKETQSSVCTILLRLINKLTGNDLEGFIQYLTLHSYEGRKYDISFGSSSKGFQASFSVISLLV
jgi:hypothetical protein